MMRNITRSKVITVCAMIASLMGGAVANPSVAAAAPPNAPEVPQAPLDTPDTLVGSGVGDYTVAAPKVFWHLRTCDQKPPALANATAATNAPNAPVIIPDSESISRIAVQGSETRQLYSASVAGFCGALAHIANANMVADANYIYWVTDQGLVRLSTNANPGDTPQVFNKDLTSYYAAELAIDCKSQCKRGPFTSQNGTHLSEREKKQQPEMGPPEHKGEANNSQIGTHLLKTNLVRGGGILMRPARRGANGMPVF